MQEEIFGPILPVLTYETFEDLYTLLKDRERPLALYIFSENKQHINEITERIPYGGGCINDTLSHVASLNLPFGGVGTSGMGRYHGESSFKTFTYEKAIVKKDTKLDIKLVFPPYKNKIKLIKKLMK